MFDFYATIGSGDDLFAVNREGFQLFINQCELANEEVTGQRGADLNIILRA